MRISCILAPNRNEFTDHALRMFETQTHPDKELVIVLTEGRTHGPLPLGTVVVEAGPGLTWGERINLGCSRSSGEIIHRLDDDDYYAPDFLTQAADALFSYSKAAACYWNQYLVYFSRTCQCRVVPPGKVFVCGSAVFHRHTHELAQYPASDRAVDLLFLAEVGKRFPGSVLKIENHPESFVYTRHGGGLDNWKDVPLGPLAQVKSVDASLMDSSFPYKGINPIPGSELEFYSRVSGVSHE